MSLSKSLKRKVDSETELIKTNGETISHSSYPVSLMENQCVSQCFKWKKISAGTPLIQLLPGKLGSSRSLSENCFIELSTFQTNYVCSLACGPREVFRGAVLK